MSNDMNNGGRPVVDDNRNMSQQQQPPPPPPQSSAQQDMHMRDNNGGPPTGGGGGPPLGSAALRPVFLGNLSNSYTSSDIIEIFERPICPPNTNFTPIPVDRVDLKRGYSFVFLKDALTQDDKINAERFVSDINGMEVRNVSPALRAEFARGDGRVKRKEDDRRKRILPSETLFVVNFHEQTTKREDLRMLFEPYGELVRIEMKRNYAFVQFRTIEQATQAKEEVNGGKLDQSVLTVEYVAQQRGEGDRRGGGRGGGGDRDRDRDRGRFNDRRRDRRHDDRRRSPPRGGDRYDDRDYDRRRSPPRYRRSSRSRSRSPPRHRSRSPPRRDDHDRFGFGTNDRGGRFDDRGDRDRGDRGYRP
mmetsp:Transcript_34524/g.39340  ORF Transcript_34524/g.39340 Transcript_34524/m.39340 type:complete len:360 (-) Transcript_34524:154-1233(-)